MDANVTDPRATELMRVLLPRIAALREYVGAKIPVRFRTQISADDVLQEICLAALRAERPPNLKDAHAVEIWVYTLADSRLIDQIRRVRARKRGGDARLANDRRLTSLGDLFARLQTPQRTPSGEVRTAEAAHAVTLSLHWLTEKHRRAIEMRFLEGLSRHEIAQRMGRSESDVNSLLHQGLRHLRSMLGEASRYLSDVGSLTRRAPVLPES